MANWGDSFNQGLQGGLDTALRSGQLGQEQAYKIWQMKQQQVENQMKMAAFGYTPQGPQQVATMGGQPVMDNQTIQGMQPQPGAMNIGGTQYAPNAALLGNLQALKPNMGSNIIVPQSLQGQDSKGLSGTEVLDKLDPNTAEVVKGMTDYTLDPSKVTSMRGNQRMQVAGLAKRVDPNFNMQLYPARASYMKDVYGGEIYKNATALNTLSQHLDNLDKSIEQAHMSGQPIANAILFKARELTGDPTITDIKTAKEVVDSEVQRALTSAAVTEQGMKQQRSLQKLDLSNYAQAKQYVKSLAHIASQRSGQMEESFTQRMGKPSNGLITNPSAQAVYDRLGGAGTQSFTVKGKQYNIPADQVDEFKKDMGIE